jgi:hypothetical protein
MTVLNIYYNMFYLYLKKTLVIFHSYIILFFLWFIFEFKNWFIFDFCPYLLWSFIDVYKNSIWVIWDALHLFIFSIILTDILKILYSFHILDYDNNYYHNTNFGFFIIGFNLFSWFEVDVFLYDKVTNEYDWLNISSRYNIVFQYVNEKLYYEACLCSKEDTKEMFYFLLFILLEPFLDFFLNLYYLLFIFIIIINY